MIDADLLFKYLEPEIGKYTGFLNSTTSQTNMDGSKTIKFNMAGTPKSDLGIDFQGNFLRVLVRGTPKKTFQFDTTPYDLEKSSAEYNNGMLTVTFPKKEPDKFKIEIK